mmetsp:Transcript_12194/g.22102  ORF Transcript_12194/g.22102 Transcript_12194/m.22102 type:complete len:85 (+) Transcript_12194:143-397(+)
MSNGTFVMQAGAYTEDVGVWGGGEGGGDILAWSYPAERQRLKTSSEAQFGVTLHIVSTATPFERPTPSFIALEHLWQKRDVRFT